MEEQEKYKTDIEKAADAAAGIIHLEYMRTDADELTLRDALKKAYKQGRSDEKAVLPDLLDAMIKEENEALGKVGFYNQYERETHANNKYCLSIVKSLIETRLKELKGEL